MTGTDVITVEQVEDVLLHGNDLDVVSPDAIQDDMVRRILAAESLEQAFGTFESTPPPTWRGSASSSTASRGCAHRLRTAPKCTHSSTLR